MGKGEEEERRIDWERMIGWKEDRTEGEEDGKGIEGKRRREEEIGREEKRNRRRGRRVLYNIIIVYV